jgi:hypothetical protein
MPVQMDEEIDEGDKQVRHSCISCTPERIDRLQQVPQGTA